MRDASKISIALSAVLLMVGATAAVAQEPASNFEISCLGGIQALNKNETGLPANLIGVPVVGTVAYRFSPRWVGEGEFGWLVPTQQSLDVGTGSKVDLKGQDAVVYQVGLRGHLRIANWSPYLAAGAGGMTFLSSSAADRFPELDREQTMFMASFGGGAQYAIGSRWGLRGDFREFLGFPGTGQGFTANGSAGPIWIERGTVGLDYKF